MKGIISGIKVSKEPFDASKVPLDLRIMPLRDAEDLRYSYWYEKYIGLELEAELTHEHYAEDRAPVRIGYKEHTSKEELKRPPLSVADYLFRREYIQERGRIYEMWAEAKHHIASAFLIVLNEYPLKDPLGTKEFYSRELASPMNLGEYRRRYNLNILVPYFLYYYSATGEKAENIAGVLTFIDQSRACLFFEEEEMKKLKSFYKNLFKELTRYKRQRDEGLFTKVMIEIGRLMSQKMLEFDVYNESENSYSVDAIKELCLSCGVSFGAISEEIKNEKYSQHPLWGTW
ncbi:hypothetical protein [Parasutterella muris]|uniref:hypothetical protein n=1 Tax=Parasutterella muris TaxID=2565572 RepID=UPI00203A991E|nr:hypothetical protein [Parasutterella muris]